MTELEGTAPSSSKAANDERRPAFGSKPETVALLLSICGFAAALYFLAHLFETIISDRLELGSGVHVVWNLWSEIALAALVPPGLIWVSLRLLRFSGRLSTDRYLLSSIKHLGLSGNDRLNVVARVASRWSEPPASQNEHEESDDQIRVTAAGEWVLQRFEEGSVVFAVPQKLADPEKLRAALSSRELTLKVLRPGRSDENHD